MNPPVSRLPTLFFAYPLTQHAGALHGAVYLRFPHDVVDGIGVLHILNRLVELASRSYMGFDITPTSCEPENCRLTLPVRVTSKIAEHPTEQQKLHFKEIMTENTRLQSEKPFLGLPMAASISPSKTQRVSLTLPKTMIGPLLKCKNHGLTITHVVSAAIMMALRDMQPSRVSKSTWRYSNHALINMRPRNCAASDSFAVGNYHMLAPYSMAIDIDANPVAAKPTDYSANELISVANQFRDYHTKVWPGSDEPSADLVAIAPMVWDLFTPKPTAAPAPQPPTAAVAISSLGNLSSIIQAQHGPLQITNVWVAGEPLGTGVSTFLQTWSDVLSISMLFNSAFHDRGCIEAFQRRTLTHLIEKMGLESQGSSN